MVSVQYYECVPPVDAIEWMLGCNLHRWAIGEEEDNLCGRGTHRPGSGSREQYGEEWFRLVRIHDVKGNFHIRRATMDIKSHTVVIPWNEQRRYIKRCFTEQELEEGTTE